MSVFCPEPILIKAFQPAFSDNTLAVIALVSHFFQFFSVDLLYISKQMGGSLSIRIYSALRFRDHHSRACQQRLLDSLSGFISVSICIRLIQLILSHILQRHKAVSLDPGGVQAGAYTILCKSQDLSNGLDFFLGLYIHFPRNQSHRFHCSLTGQQILIPVIDTSSLCLQSRYAYSVAFA